MIYLNCSGNVVTLSCNRGPVLIGVDCTVLAYASNEPDCLSDAGISCFTFEKGRIKRCMKTNKTKIH